MGLPSHLSDIYLEELNKAIAATFDQSSLPAPLGALLDPFFSLMAQTSNNITYERIESSLLKPLLEALTVPPRSDNEPTPKHARKEPELYSDLIAHACITDPQASGSLDRTTLRREILRAVFEVASRPETRDASRRKMYTLWKEGIDEDEDEE